MAGPTNGVVVGIDPGRLTGWSVLGNGKPRAGTWTLRDRGTFSSYDLDILRGRCNELRRQFGPFSTLVHEQPIKHGRGDAHWQHPTMIRTAVEYLTDSQTEVLEVHPMTLKKAITGSGKADKDEVEAAVRELYPKLPRDLDDNAIDAVALACWGEDVDRIARYKLGAGKG